MQAWSEAAFNKAAGVGIIVSSAEVKAEVSRVIKENEANLKAERYHGSKKLFGQIKLLESLKWANTKEVKETYDEEISALLGPNTDADNAKPVKKSVPPAAAPAPKTDEAKVTSQEETPDLLEGRPIPAAVNTEAQMAAHLKVCAFSNHTQYFDVLSFLYLSLF